MVRAKKYLGQHFLRQDKTASDIANLLEMDQAQEILEIGAGTGVLTQFLIKKDWPLRVVEVDQESIIYLEKHYPELNGNIIPGDFLQLALADYLQKPTALIGNYPYHISSQIVFKMLDNVDWFPEMVGMFQKEVAQRLVAEPGTKTYGILSVLCAARYHREYCFTVPPGAFIPPPKVDSGVIRFKRKKDYQLPVAEEHFRMVVKTAFNQRRKTLRNALKALPLPGWQKATGLLSKRAEQLSYEDFLTLTRCLEP